MGLPSRVGSRWGTYARHAFPPKLRRDRGFAIYLASKDGYQDSILPSGYPVGTAEEALDCACGLASGTGQPLHARLIRQIRTHYQLPSHTQRLRDAGLLSLAEIARRLGIHPNTVKKWRNDGLLTRRLANDKGEYLYQLPGPNLLYILTRSIGQGRRAGLASAVGVETGTLLHVTAATSGLSSLVATSALAFGVVRYAGAAYLVWLGIRALLRPSEFDLSRNAAPPLGRVYRDGVVVNLLNPKVALFFLAFLPQFITPGAEPAAARPQLLVLGAVFFALALVLDVATRCGINASAGRCAGCERADGAGASRVSDRRGRVGDRPAGRSFPVASRPFWVLGGLPYPPAPQAPRPAQHGLSASPPLSAPQTTRDSRYR